MITFIGMGAIATSLASDSSGSRSLSRQDALAQRLGVSIARWPVGSQLPAWVVADDAYQQTLEFWECHCRNTGDAGMVRPALYWVLMDELPVGSWWNDESYAYSLDRLSHGEPVRPVLFGHDLSAGGKPYLVDGRHRLAAAEELGLVRVPVFVVDNYYYERD